MHLRLLSLLALAVAAVLVGTAGGSTARPTAALAAKGKGKDRPKRNDLSASKDLWATINVCDTRANPNTIGIRGSMPGLGHKRSKLQMRFQVQYKARSDGEWRFTGDSADSGWQTVGRTIRQIIESGQNFTFAAPTDGGAHQLRGSVRFRWIRGGKTRAYQQRFTEPGHRSTAGADPKGYSAGMCEITQP